MPSRGGFSYASDGRLNTTTAAITTSAFSGGWAIRVADGLAYIIGLGNNPVPAGAQYIGGFAFSQAGALYITEQAVANSDIYIAGARLRADGALRCVEASPVASDPAVGGWRFQASSGFPLCINNSVT